MMVSIAGELNFKKVGPIVYWIPREPCLLSIIQAVGGSRRISRVIVGNCVYYSDDMFGFGRPVVLPGTQVTVEVEGEVDDVLIYYTVMP